MRGKDALSPGFRRTASGIVPVGGREKRIIEIMGEIKAVLTGVGR
jgi:hypothetical protein